MDKLKRYDMCSTICQDVHATNSADDGESIFPASWPLKWCRDSDVEALEDENQQLKKDLKCAMETIESIAKNDVKEV